MVTTNTGTINHEKKIVYTGIVSGSHFAAIVEFIRNVIVAVREQSCNKLPNLSYFKDLYN